MCYRLWEGQLNRLWEGQLRDGHLCLPGCGPASSSLSGSFVFSSFPFVFFSLLLILYVGGRISFGKYWVSPPTLESQRGAYVVCEELSWNLRGFYSILVPSWTVGTQGKLLHLSCSCLLPSSEDKYLKGCEALGCDGCRGLRDLRPCTYDYSILMKLVCCGKYENLICKQWGLNATFISLLSVGNILLISLTMSEGQGWCCI